MPPKKITHRTVFNGRKMVFRRVTAQKGGAVATAVQESPQEVVQEAPQPKVTVDPKKRRAAIVSDLAKMFLH